MNKAKEGWKCLEDRYANSSKEMARDLLRELQEVQRENYDPMDEYIHELKIICDELHKPIDDVDKVYWAYK